MKLQKLLVVGLLTGLCAALVPFGAVAQQAEIINEFCEETQDLIDEVNQDLSRNGEDLAECFDDYDRCDRRADNGIEASQCIGKFTRCAGNASQDAEQACDRFRRRFKDEYKDALRAADIRDVDDEVRESSVFQACLANGLDTVAFCGGISED